MKKQNSEQLKSSNNESMSQSVLPIIYGIIDFPTNIGVQAYAMDGNTGEIIDSHFCSSEGFAKSDLGFTSPLFEKCAFSDDQHSTVSFNSTRKNKYQERYPSGYTMVWVGLWENDESMISLKNKAQQLTNF